MAQQFHPRLVKKLSPEKKTPLGGGNSNIFYFHPYLGKWSSLTNIFQMGWNHQLGQMGRVRKECWSRIHGSIPWPFQPWIGNFCRTRSIWVILVGRWWIFHPSITKPRIIRMNVMVKSNELFIVPQFTKKNDVGQQRFIMFIRFSFAYLIYLYPGRLETDICQVYQGGRPGMNFQSRTCFFTWFLQEDFKWLLGVNVIFRQQFGEASQWTTEGLDPQNLHPKRSDGKTRQDKQEVFGKD